MQRLLKRLRYVYRWLTDRQGYFSSQLFGLRVPVFPLAHLPDGFRVERIGDTGLNIVDNFCSREEAEYLIESARSRLHESRITVDNRQIKDPYRRSQTAVVYNNTRPDPRVMPLLYRAAMLLGLPATHAESLIVTRYSEGDYYKPHEDFYPGFDGDRLYTVLIYLNDLEENQGGDTLFERLQVGVRPRLGRAVVWTNTNPDGSRHPETRHEAMPVTNGGEKWVIQLWFRSYPMLKVPKQLISPPQAATGRALTESEQIPGEAWTVGEVIPGSPHERAFSWMSGNRTSD